MKICFNIGFASSSELVNPHVHGLNYVCGNPTFELVVEDDQQRDALIKANYPGAEAFQTKAEAEAQLADFYSEHVRESHPCKNEQGDRLYDSVIENLKLKGERQASKSEPATIAGEDFRGPTSRSRSQRAQKYPAGANRRWQQTHVA